jgi:hypothetical protein
VNGPIKSEYTSIVNAPFAFASSGRLAGEEGGLEGVLGALRAVKKTAADGHDHRAVSAHQGLERFLVFLPHVAVQEVAVRQTRNGLVGHDAAKMLDPRRPRWHSRPDLDLEARPPIIE